MQNMVRAMTEQNLISAFCGESQAHLRYLIFAKRAKEAGFPNISRLFTAVAHAEKIHASNHYRNIVTKGPQTTVGGALFGSRHARYERVRDSGVIAHQAVLIAIGINWEGKRQVLAVEMANRESQSSWKDFLLRLKERGLSGVEFVVSDDHAGLKKAIFAVLTEAAWQRCYVHFLRNALDYLPRKADDDCLQELRWIYDRRDIQEAQQDLAAWIGKWQGKYPKLVDWVEGNIIETLTFYRLPRAHHKHLKSTNMLERLNEEIKRRTLVVRIFPNTESCLRLIRALCVETHETWLEDNRYLNMTFLAEQKKELLRLAA